MAYKLPHNGTDSLGPLTTKIPGQVNRMMTVYNKRIAAGGILDNVKYKLIAHDSATAGDTVNCEVQISENNE